MGEEQSNCRPPGAGKARRGRRSGLSLDHVPSRFSSRDHRPRRGRGRGPAGEAVITVIIGGRALLMLIAARFSGPGSGKDLLSRAISLIASDLLPFSSFPIPVAPDSYRGRDRPACRIPCARRGMAHRVQPQ
jgi:hypothetical protein